ncbi:MAG TPA: hypothetical protein VGR71_16530 [Nitrospira sp.]|nr:hypothetical protein [Nitrospira sp.]
MSSLELSRPIAMSAPADRLEESGIIKRYRLEIDSRAPGYPLLAFARVRPTPGALPKMAALTPRLPEITEC